MVGMSELVQHHVWLLCAGPVHEIETVRDFDAARLRWVVGVSLPPSHTRETWNSAPSSGLLPHSTQIVTFRSAETTGGGTTSTTSPNCRASSARTSAAARPCARTCWLTRTVNPWMDCSQ